MCDNCSMGDKPLLSKLHSAGTWLSWSHCPQPVETSNRDEEARDRRGKAACSLRGYLDSWETQGRSRPSVGVSILSLPGSSQGSSVCVNLSFSTVKWG